MNASPRSPHKRWQFHLGTGLALMLLAAVFVGLNVTPSRSGSIIGSPMRSFQERGLGWPMHFYNIDSVETHTGDSQPGRSVSLGETIFGVVFDFTIALTVMAICGNFVESEIRLRVRLREARRVPPKMNAP